MERAIDLECLRQEITSAGILAERAVDHTFVIKEHRIPCPQPTSLHHCGARLSVAMLLVPRPREQVVTVNVFSRLDFLLHIRENFWNTTIVIEEEKAPPSMISTGLTRNGDFHRLVIVFGLRSIADCGIRVADCPKRCGIELDCDAAL